MKPKILFVSNYMTHYTRDLFERLAAKGNVRFLFFSDGGEWYFRSPVEPIGELPGRYLPGTWFLGTRWSWTLVRELWASDADAIVLGMSGRFATFITFSIAKLRRIPLVVWISFFELPRHGLQRLARPLVASIVRGAVSVVTNGPHESEMIRGLGVPEERLSESPWATPREPFIAPVDERKVSDVLGGQRPAFVIGYVGRLETWKGPDLAVTALARLLAHGTDAILLIAGAGRARLPLEELANSLGVGERVRFLGRLPYEALPATYRAMDVLVIPSRAGLRGRTEDWALVANEAMLSEVAVVASTAVGAVRGGLIEDGVTGRVFPEDDVDVLAEILGDLSGDANERCRLTRRASARIAGYTYEAAARGFEVGIDRALEARAARSAR